MNYLVLDIATTAIAGAADFLDEPAAPSNYKDAEKIATYVAEKKAEQVTKVALDPDLGRITGIGLWKTGESAPTVLLCRDEQDEYQALRVVAGHLDKTRYNYCHLIGYNALRFDWLFLLRRALYLSVPLSIDVDRYRSPHIDLAERLTHRGLLPMRSLSFYVKRLAWADLSKALSGAEEARAPETGQWPELEASLVHDVTATKRLAEWLGIWPLEREAA